VNFLDMKAAMKSPVYINLSVTR